jgi:hypothetical protein
VVYEMETGRTDFVGDGCRKTLSYVIELLHTYRQDSFGVGIAMLTLQQVDHMLT